MVGRIWVASRRAELLVLVREAAQPLSLFVELLPGQFPSPWESGAEGNSCGPEATVDIERATHDGLVVLDGTLLPDLPLPPDLSRVVLLVDPPLPEVAQSRDNWGAIVAMPLGAFPLTLALRQVVEQADWAVDRKLLEQEAVLGRLLAGILHELKNPLHNLVAGAERLAAHAADHAGLEIWIELLIRNAQLLRESLEQLLSGFKQPTAMTPIPIKPLLEEAVRYAIFADAAVRRRIRIHWDWPDPDPIIIASPGNLLHVFLNLLYNARQAIGDAEGEVRIAARWIDRNRIELDIADNGPGIDPAILPNLFERFRTTKSGGTGLGLTFCRESIERMGGNIRAEVCSLPGDNPAGLSGAVFRIQLPAATNAVREGDVP